MVCTCELNSNRPLKVWRMAVTPTRKPCLTPTCARMTSAARAGRALAKDGLSRKKRSEEPRLNSSHLVISYAVFCLKKKNSQKAENERGPHRIHTRRAAQQRA